MKIIEKKKLKNEIFEGTISLTIATIIVKVLGAIYKIPISRILGEEGMGYFNSAYTVYSFFYLLCTAGVPKAIMILIGNAQNELQKNKTKSILSTAVAFFAVVSFLISLVFFMFSKPLSIAIGSKESYKAMWAIAPSIVFVAVAGVLRGYMSANMKFFHVAVAQIIEGLGKLVFGLIFANIADRLYMPINLVSSFTIFGVTCGSIFGLIYLLFNIKFEKYKENTRQLSIIERTSIIKGILKISMPITLSAAIMSITNVIDLGLIMRQLAKAGYHESQATALYGNYTTYATPIFNLAISLFTPITIAFMPSLVKKNKDRNEFLITLEHELLSILWISIPLTVGICLYSEQILNLLFGGDGVITGGRLLTYLSLSLFFVAPLLVLNSALEAMGEVKAPLISMALGSVVKLIVSYFLISNPNFGILGAPIGTLASYTVALCTSLLIAWKRGSVVLPIIKTVALPAINSFISIFLVYPLYLKHTAINENVAFIIAVLITIVVYILLTLLTEIKLNLMGHEKQVTEAKG